MSPPESGDVTASLSFYMRLFVSALSLLVSLTVLASDKLEAARAIAERQLASKDIVVSKHTEAYCIFSRLDQGGYAIVSTRQVGNPRLLAFSREGSWRESDVPPAVEEWLDRLDTLRLAPVDNSMSRRAEESQERTDIQPLLTCHWHQRSPYNDLAPVITDGQVKTVAGCVAIAAAQVTYYWRQYNPESTMKDTPTYVYGGAPVTEVIPKGSPNNWDLMLDSYDSNSSAESRAAVAQLCYVLGTTSYLNYATSTGGSIRDVSNAMYSQYRILSDYIYRANYDRDWEALLYYELQNGHPIICSGSGSGPTGHAFVLDGYDSATKFFHFNFGWGGSGDGYYPADESPEAMGGYYQGQAVLVDIHPRMVSINVTSAENGRQSVKQGIYDMRGCRLDRVPLRGFYIVVDADGVRKKYSINY